MYKNPLIKFQKKKWKRETINFSIAINLTKDVKNLYTENHKILLWETEEDRKKWKDILPVHGMEETKERKQILEAFQGLLEWPNKANSGCPKWKSVNRTEGNHWSTFCYYRLILLNLELHADGTIC